MTGRVRCYLPAARRGILQADSGEELAFSISEDMTDLHGGDIVEFDLAEDGPRVVSNLTLRHRWSEMLSQRYRPLVRQFHDTIRIHA